MKVIKVENQVQGGKVAFEILKENWLMELKLQDLRQEVAHLNFTKEIVESDLDFSNLTSVNLDEYVGLDGDNPQSYRYFMQENLFNQNHLKKVSCLVVLRTMLKLKLNATTKFWLTIQLTSKSWESVAMGISALMSLVLHLTVKRIQQNLTSLLSKPMHASLPRLKTSQPKLFQWGLKHFGCQVYYSFAYGESKAEAIAGTVSGPVTENLPASSLQNHPDVTVIADAEALSLLEK